MRAFRHLTLNMAIQSQNLNDPNFNYYVILSKVHSEPTQLLESCYSFSFPTQFSDRRYRVFDFCHFNSSRTSSVTFPRNLAKSTEYSFPMPQDVPSRSLPLRLGYNRLVANTETDLTNERRCSLLKLTVLKVTTVFGAFSKQSFL